MFSKAIEVIEGNRSFLIAGHQLPDGDCLGAEVGLYHLLRSMDREVAIRNSDPVPRSLRFLQEETPIGVFREGEELPPFDVLVMVDCHSLARLGAVGRAVAGRKATRLVVDHHVGGACGDGDVALVDELAPATGVLVYDLYRRMGAPMEMAAARGLFVSITTDTGWFRYSNTDDQALAVAADLAARGVDPSALYDRIFRSNPPETLPLLAQALAGARLEAGGRIAVAALDRDFVRRTLEAGWETDEILEPMRSVEGVEVVALLKETGKGRVKVSLRSRGRLDVDGVARAMGGGGHHKAAGAELAGPLEDARAEVLRRLGALLGPEV